MSRTHALVDPIVNFADGKVQRLLSIEKSHPGIKIVGGMGNSWSTDGAFLRFISTERQGMSVIFNAGPPSTDDEGASSGTM